MVRILLIILAIGAILAGAHYFGDYAGNVVISVPGYVAETNLPFLIAILFLAFILIGLALKTLGTLFFFRRKLDAWRGRNAVRYLDRWNVAMMAGDNKEMKKTEARLPRVFRRKHADSALLMRARTLLENGDYAEATSIYQGLLGTKDKRPAALKGMTDIALSKGDSDEAARYAKEAAEEHNDLIWPRVVLRDIYIQQRDRRLAAFRSEELLHLFPKGNKSKPALDYSVAALARAEELFQAQDKSTALTLAAKAHKTSPASEHLTLMYAEFLEEAGDIGALHHVIYEQWKKAPHYNLGLLFLESVKDDSERVKTKKIAELQTCNPASYITWLIRAQLYNSISQTGTAKEALRQAQELHPSKEGFLLYAQAEELQEDGAGDQFKAAEYRKQAELAPSVAEHYTCANCGRTEPLPQTECTACRAYDAYKQA